MSTKFGTKGLHSKKNTIEEYVNLYISTAEAIRSVHPEARLLAMAIAGIHPELADGFLAEMQKRDKLHLIDQITYHPYNKNPDAVYDEVLRLRTVVNKYAPRITIRQGENGAPSEFRKTKALNSYNWSETSQSKWALRRLLGDLGRDIESSYFSIVDLNYPDEINRKGTLESDNNRKVVKAKPVYYALQHLAAIFDESLGRIESYPYSSDNTQSLSLFAFENKVTGKQIIALWLDGEIPSDSEEKQPISLTIPQGNFQNPVWWICAPVKSLKFPENISGSRVRSFPFKKYPFTIHRG
ncbi:MAG: hypothetical protein HC842_06335 [Cytophagales bacterium]|nr:hypothetical protein [Cytophagales bacterium]